MARQFKTVDRDQPMMLPEDMRLWVSRDHFVWFLIDVIGGLDATGLEALGKPGRGRPGTVCTQFDSRPGGAAGPK